MDIIALLYRKKQHRTDENNKQKTTKIFLMFGQSVYITESKVDFESKPKFCLKLYL